MTIAEFHASHIRRINVAFVLSAPNLDPGAVTEVVGIAADKSARRGDERRNPRGEVVGSDADGWWRIDSMPRLAADGIRQKDINEHFRVVLGLVLPHRDDLLQFASEGETFFDVLWESTYLYAGTGPLIDQDCLAGVASLKASMGFDIYQIDEDDGG